MEHPVPDFHAELPCERKKARPSQEGRADVTT
jgi:hypothetical protein